MFWRGVSHRSKWRERVGEICVGDDELGFEVVKDEEPTEAEKEKRRKNSVLGRSISPWPTSLV